MEHKEHVQPVIDEEAVESDPKIAPGEIVIGTLVGIDTEGKPLVNYPGNVTNTQQVAITTLGLTLEQTGRQVALLFADGDLQKPVIMGMIHSHLDTMLDSYEVTVPQSGGDLVNTKGKMDTVIVDGKRVVIEGKEEIVLKCGEASITLTKAGKIIIRGKYLLNRSSGMHRIMGGSVQIN